MALFEPSDFYDPTKDQSIKVGNTYLLLDKRDRKLANAFAEFAAMKSNLIVASFLKSLPVHEGTLDIPEGSEARVIITTKEKPQPNPSPKSA
jgi:hypothetical protein